MCLVTSVSMLDMFTQEQIDSLRGEQTLESLCAVVQLHFPRIMYCIGRILYFKDSRKAFLQQIVSVRKIMEKWSPCPGAFSWFFEITWSYSYKVYVFDQELADSLNELALNN